MPRYSQSEDEETALVRKNSARKRQLPARFRNENEPEAFLTNKELETLNFAKELRRKEIIRGNQLPFVDARRRKIEELLDQGVFEIVSAVPQDLRVFNSRFVDDIKGLDAIPYEKSRLVI